MKKTITGQAKVAQVDFDSLSVCSDLVKEIQLAGEQLAYDRYLNTKKTPYAIIFTLQFSELQIQVSGNTTIETNRY